GRHPAEQDAIEVGQNLAVKGGIGMASAVLGSGYRVGALAVVNAFGDVLDPAWQQIVAGVRSPEGDGFADTVALLADMTTLNPRSLLHGHER
ncbi:hypothetical protein ACFL59_12485, partial [Planctomycetota bacterium]